MAVTSLWHIKGSLKTLIDYVENPEKTAPRGTEDFFQVFDYVRRPDKTHEEYVTAINCMKSIALQQMILTKQQYRKSDKYIAWHGYQSFKVGEVDPDTAHKIGIKLAKEMWGDKFQIVVTTHLDRDHIHNHFAFNSVSFLDGRKYNYSKTEQKRLRQVSDRLCREYGLSVIQRPRKAPNRPVWLDEKAGKETRYRIYREDIRDAINFSRSPKYMELYLNRLGYLTDFTGEHWKIRLPQQEHYTYLDTLDERWYPREITRIMGYYGNRQAVVTFPPDMPAEVGTYYTPHVPTSRIYHLHLYYCYELGILPKHTDYKPTSPYLKEDLRKLDELTAQTDYMSRNKIETLQDLYADRSRIEANLAELTAYRTKLQNKIRRASPEEKVILREEKAKVTAQITNLRKRLKCNRQIEERSIRNQENLDRVYDNGVAAEKAAQERKQKKRSYER